MQGGSYMNEIFLISPERKDRICEYFTDNFRVIRREIGMKQEELAEVVGTTQRHISQIENGKAKVSWTLTLALYTVLMTYPQIWQNDKFYLEEEPDELEEQKEWVTLLKNISD